MSELLGNMDGGYDELTRCLGLEVHQYKALGQLLKDKQKSIINGDVEALQKYVHEEQRLIPKIRKATRARELRTATIGAVSNLGKKAPSLKELINLSPSHYSQQLISYRGDLITCLDQIAHSNRENEYLLNSSVDLVRGLVQILLGKNEDENIHYGGQGKITPDNTPNAHVDCQV